MAFLFSFQGRMSRLPYALASLAVFGSQHVFVFAALRGRISPWGWEFLLIPLRTFAERAYSAADLAPGLLALQLLTMWMLAAFAFRRAADAGYGEWMAAFAIAPIAQLPVILILAAAPPSGRTPRSESAAASRVNWPLAVQGALAGMMFIVAAVALSTLVFGAYGYGVFLVTPYVMGLATAMIANRQADIGRRATTRLVFGALALGGAALVLTAIEGAACVVMAAPLAAGMAYLGGITGRLLAIRSQRSLWRSMQSVSVLPLVLIGETVLTPVVSFETHNVIEIGASPSAVWDSLVHMEKLDEPAPAFRLGFAYPLKGRIVGEGVGALRLGTFSTGTAIERITAWERGRRLLHGRARRACDERVEPLHQCPCTACYRLFHHGRDQLRSAPGGWRRDAADRAQRSHAETRSCPLLAAARPLGGGPQQCPRVGKHQAQSRAECIEAGV